MDLDARLDKIRREVRIQRQQLQDCVQRSAALRASADAHRREAVQRCTGALPLRPFEADGRA